MNLIELAIKSFSVQRIFVAALVFSSNFLAAKTLGPEQYGELALMIFLIKNFFVFNLGSVSGFLLNSYRIDNQSDLNKGYLAAYTAHLSIIGFIAIILGFALGHIYFIAAIGAVLLIPLYAIEPVYRIQRLFYISLLPDILLAFCIIFVTLFMGKMGSVLPPIQDYLIELMILQIILIYLLFSAQCYKFLLMIKESIYDLNLSIYIKTLQSGFPQYLGTLTFIGYLMVDRFFMERYHSSEETGVYMFAYQLAIGAGLLLSAHSFISGIDAGEFFSRGQKPIKIYGKLLRGALFLAIPSYFAILVIAYILEKYFLQNYLGLTIMSAFLGLGYVAFQTSCNVTGLVFYIQKQAALNLGIFVIVIIDILANILIVFNELDSRAVGFVSGFLLLGYSVFSLFYTYKICKNHQS